MQINLPKTQANSSIHKKSIKLTKKNEIQRLLKNLSIIHGTRKYRL